MNSRTSAKPGPQRSQDLSEARTSVKKQTQQHNQMMPYLSPLRSVLALGSLCLAAIAFADRPEQLLALVQQNCIDCHDGQDGEGGFDVASLDADVLKRPASEKELFKWIRVFDRIHDGEMPPPDAGEMDASEHTQLVKGLRQTLDESQSQLHRQIGRVQSRRLTRDQLEWTLNDLLAVDLPVAELMPEEERTDGFRNIAQAQSMSYYHLEDHLRIVDAALDYAFVRAFSPEQPFRLDLPATRIAAKRKGQRNREPELRQDAAVVWSSSMPFYGRINNSTVKVSGWYDIALNASSIKGPEDQGQRVWCSVRSGECTSSAPLLNWIGEFEATPEASEYTFRAWLEAGHRLEIRPQDRRLKLGRFNGGQVGFGEGEPQDLPGVAMYHLTLTQVFPGGDPDRVRKALVGDLNVKWAGNKDAPKPRRGESVTDALARFALVSQKPAQDLRRRTRQFASRAFRRPANYQVMKPYFAMITQGLEEKQPPLEVLYQCCRAILCSPRFIYFTEAGADAKQTLASTAKALPGNAIGGRLDDHAIATRLSYLLTGHGPDWTLKKAADEGKLQDPAEVIKHTRRLLKGDNLDHFVADFTDQWLDLADIAFTEPDRRMYRHFDLTVQSSMVQETRRFIKTLISENVPAHQLIDAKFTWLNNRLADYYELDHKIEDDQWRRVALGDHPHRGGLLTHGSVLKVTANGTDSSPVVRGVWLCDRILGVPIPDPPESVPAIEPDIRGAKTVREILEKHRSQSECASCHLRIDPSGFALEHFDPAGRWRDNYLVRKGGSFRTGPKVDSAYQMPDGRPFESFQQFRELAADNDDQVARSFAAKLLTYATGREMTFADRKALDQIVVQTADEQYGLRSVIEASVTSPIFLNK